MANALLEVKNLTVEYQTQEERVFAVNGISFCLEQGETLGLVGETGAGKTTSALSILRLLPQYTGKITGGEIIFDGLNVLSLKEGDMRTIRGKRISMIFQDPLTSLDPIKTVGSQIMEALLLHNESRRSHAELDQRVEEVLKLVGIPAFRKNDYPHQLSGGIKQRIVIAIALCCEPELLIADEPTTALDVTIQAQVMLLMKSLKEKFQTAMIMITHDLGIVALMCDKVGVMYAGEIVEYGTVEDIFDHGKSHHPYTLGLFGSIPNLNKDTDRLSPINGLMPDPTNLPVGCKFSPRCPECMKICKVKNPQDICFGSHSIKCHLFSDIQDKGGLKDV